MPGRAGTPVALLPVLGEESEAQTRRRRGREGFPARGPASRAPLAGGKPGFLPLPAAPGAPFLGSPKRCGRARTVGRRRGAGGPSPEPSGGRPLPAAQLHPRSGCGGGGCSSTGGFCSLGAGGLCSRSSFPSGGGLGGRRGAGVPAFQVPSLQWPESIGWCPPPGRGGPNAQTAKAGASRGSLLSSSPQRRARGEPRRYPRARGDCGARAGIRSRRCVPCARLRRRGDGLCVCVCCWLLLFFLCCCLFFFLVRNKCSGVCKAPGSPEAGSAPPRWQQAGRKVGEQAKAREQSRGRFRRWPGPGPAPTRPLWPRPPPRRAGWN